MKANPYEKFDNYGLNHFAEHLYSLDDFEHLFTIVNDVAWFTKRKEEDLLREGYQRDMGLAINCAYSNIPERSAESLSLLYLNGLIRAGLLSADPENIETFLIVGNNAIVSVLEERIYGKIRSSESNHIADADIDYLIDRCLSLFDTDHPSDALPYLNKVTTVLSKGFFQQADKLYRLKKKIAERHLGDQYLENIEPIWQHVPLFWKRAFHVWWQVCEGDFASAEVSIAHVFEALPSYGMHLVTPDFTEAKMVNGLLVIAELHEVLLGRKEAYHVLDLAWEEAIYTKSQARGAAFRLLALAYAKLGYLRKAVDALKEVPEWLRFVRIEWLEKIAIEMHKNGRTHLAKLLLLESISHRVDESSRTGSWLSSAFLNAIAKLGYKKLASDGLAVYIGGHMPIGSTERNWCNIDTIQGILLSHLKGNPISWFEILEIRDQNEKSLAEARGVKDIKRRAEIIIREFRNRHDEIYRPIEDAPPGDPVESFYASDPNCFLALDKKTMADAINSVQSATENFGWNLVVRILICDAIANCDPSSEELSNWLRLIINPQSQTHHGVLDTAYNIILYAPLLARTGLLESLLNKINQIKEFHNHLEREQESYLLDVKQALIDDLSIASNITIKFMSNSKGTLRDQLDLVNRELESEGLPIVLITDVGNLKILDLHPEELAHTTRVLSKHNAKWEPMSYQGYKEPFVAFLAR